MKGIRDATSNKLILRNIIEAKGSTNRKYPTWGQLGVKKRKMKTASHKYSDTVNYTELRKYCESKSIVPKDQEESYVVFLYY